MAAKPKGSFRGVGFYTIEHHTSVGRRQPTHARPFQDTGSISADLGRAPREFTIQAILIGVDYRDQRAKLLDALEQPGPGLLVHPELGRYLVTIDRRSIRLSESTSELNTCRLDFRAEESAEKPPQAGPLDSGAQLRASVKVAKDFAATSFANPATGLKAITSNFLKTAHLDVLDNVLSDMRSVNGMISAVLATPAGFAAQIDAISREASTLINTPTRLFAAIDGALDLIASATRRVLGPDGREIETEDADAISLAMRRGKTQLRAVAPLAALGSASAPVPAIDTQERRDQAQGQRAIQNHMRASGLLNLANAVVDAPFDSAADAGAVRDALAGALVDLADVEPELDAPFSAALRNVASAVLQHLNRIAGALPQIVSYTPPYTVPVEVLAWRLYADAERSDEICLRNPSIIDPSFVTGKRALEVKSS